jgi:hypothetical protein
VGDGATYEIRHYTFGVSSAQATWDRFGDSMCSTGSKLMSIVLTGSAQITGMSSDVFGAWDIIVSIDNKTITPTSTGLSSLQQGTCGAYTWQADTPTTITTGCGDVLQQTDDCPAEYDLLKPTFHGLVFGDRSHPLCSEDTRPTQLSAFAVTLDPFGYVSPVSAPDSDAGDVDPGADAGDAAADGETANCAGLADGSYCGSDEVGGEPSTLYQCSGGNVAATQVCSSGCSLADAAGTDSCN